MDFEHEIKRTGILQMAGKMMGDGMQEDLHKDVEWLVESAEMARNNPELATKIRDACKASALVSAAEKPTGDLTDERALFEAEERKHSSNLTRQADGQYENPCTQSAWEGWQARAAIAAHLERQAQAEQPAIDPRNEAEISRELLEVARGTGDDYLRGLLQRAASEANRFYGGMMAWKRTAQKKDRDWNNERMARENERCAARAAKETTPASQEGAHAALEEVRPQWTSVADSLPEKYCLAVYETPSGKQRIIRAMYVAKFTVEAQGDDCYSEINDENDIEYLREGWYELIDNWGEYSSVNVCEGVVTHWQPLPPLPSLQTPACAERSGDHE